MATCADIVRAKKAPKPRPKPGSKEFVCVDCVREGTRWVHLRTNQTDGKTRCCDSSPMQHSRRHWEKNRTESTIQSAEPGEDWFYCFNHDSFSE